MLDFGEEKSGVQGTPGRLLIGDTDLLGQILGQAFPHPEVVVDDAVGL